MKSGQTPPNPDYKGKFYGRDILMKKVLAKNEVLFVNTVVELLERNQKPSSGLTPDQRDVKL